MPQLSLGWIDSFLCRMRLQEYLRLRRCPRLLVARELIFGGSNRVCIVYRGQRRNYCTPLFRMPRWFVDKFTEIPQVNL